MRFLLKQFMHFIIADNSDIFQNKYLQAVASTLEY